MTGPARPCVSIACPYAQRVSGISGQARRNASLSGQPGLRFRAIAVEAEPARQARNSTANAVGWQHPPGFKSPILRHLSSSFARKCRSGRAAAPVLAWPLRVHQGHRAVLCPGHDLRCAGPALPETCQTIASRWPAAVPDHRWLACDPGSGWRVPGPARGRLAPGRAVMTSEGAPARLPPGGRGSAGEVEGGADECCRCRGRGGGRHSRVSRAGRSGSGPARWPGCGWGVRVAAGHGDRRCGAVCRDDLAGDPRLGRLVPLAGAHRPAEQPGAGHPGEVGC